MTAKRVKPGEKGVNTDNVKELGVPRMQSAKTDGKKK
jgi:hypothetical protein